MGKLADFVKEYFATAPSEVLVKDWEELKVYNAYGCDILDVMDNYGRKQMCSGISMNSRFSDDTNPYYSDSELCLAS